MRARHAETVESGLSTQLRGPVKEQIPRVRAVDAAAAVKRYSQRCSERVSVTAKTNRSIGGSQVSPGISKLQSKTAIELSDVTLTPSVAPRISFFFHIKAVKGGVQI